MPRKRVNRAVSRAIDGEPAAPPTLPVSKADFTRAPLHDDVLLTSGRAAAFLGIPDSTFYALRNRLGSDFPPAVDLLGHPRFRVGTLRRWLAKREAATEVQS